MPARMKPTMMVISRMLATLTLTWFMTTELSRLKPQMMAATARHMPPRVSSRVRLSRLMRWQSEVTMTPARVEKKVARRMGMKTSVGCAAPICAR